MLAQLWDYGWRRVNEHVSIDENKGMQSTTWTKCITGAKEGNLDHSSAPVKRSNWYKSTLCNIFQNVNLVLVLDPFG